MSEDDPIDAVSRTRAASGRVSYSDPVVIHETRDSMVKVVPFFIPRSEGTDLSVKIQTYKKGKLFSAPILHEEKSISLKEPAARQLLKTLQKLFAVAEENADGSYLVLRVDEGTMAIGEHDPQLVASALTKVLGQAEIVEHLAHTELSHELASAFRTAIRLSEMRNAVAQLQEHLDGGVRDEKTYQEWCDRHAWAFGNAYVMRDEVRNISASDRLDVMLPLVISGYRDIVELKRPDMAVLNWDPAHRNHYFSADVSAAIGQAHRYLDVLHEVAANGLRDHPEVVAYHPRATIVIGRSHDWPQDKLRALHGLNRRLNGISVMTYDQLLAQGQRLVAFFTDSGGSTDGDDIDDGDFE